jgi:protein HIRA/HIR1
VKGVAWDPIGRYIASKSDDKTVRIWRTTDWGLEKIIDKPYARQTASSFFNRIT